MYDWLRAKASRIRRSRSPNPARGPLPSSGSSSSQGGPGSRTAGSIWEGLKTSLRLVKESSDAFPPLKSLSGGLVALIDLVENSCRNQEDSAGLEAKLSSIVSVINACSAGSMKNEASFKRLDELLKSIQAEIVKAQNIQSQGSVSNIANATKDRENLNASYKRISELLDMFLVETALAIERTVLAIGDTASRHYLMNLLDKLDPVESALYNATSPAPRRACTDNTRLEVLSKFISWALDKDDKTIYYLNGMAGTGKTTLAYTLSQILRRMGFLGGTFFCSRADQSCSDANRIVPTLASQLAQHSSSYCDQLRRVLDENAGRQGENIDLRFNNLIVKPCKAAPQTNDSPIVVVIDALDECRDDDHVLIFLQNLWTHASQLPIKFFITSRPERPFQDRVYSTDTVSTRFHLHNVEASFVERDIRLFIEERLRCFGRQYRNRGIGVDNNWPPEDQVESLTALSGKLFIYASTACEYVASSKLNLSQRLTSVIDMKKDSSRVQTGTLDALYAKIMGEAYDGCEASEKETMNRVLGAVMVAESPLNIESLAELLRVDFSGIQNCLSLFQSVLFVPIDSSPVTTLHASFPDFLSTFGRSKQFFLDPIQFHSMFAKLSFNLMADRLQENICKVDGRPNNTEISKVTLKQSINAALSYACSHWASHVRKSGDYEEMDGFIRDQILDFFMTRSLPWIECLSLIGGLHKAVSLLQMLEIWLPKSNVETVSLIYDVRRFLSQNVDLLTVNALEVYNSALLWLPQRSKIDRMFRTGRNLPRVVSGLPDTWDPCEMILTGHSDVIQSVAFSPDGALIASASHDKTIRIWNAANGQLKHELSGHSLAVWSVGFSPDGTRLVSGSVDMTVRVWNAASGLSEQEIIGHSGPIRSVSFSPNGTRVASCSDDKTIRVWILSTGEVAHEMTGHSEGILSIAFSPDGTYIASASHDATVRIWNVPTGKLVHEMTDHLDTVLSVSFSADGSLIASASQDKTLRIWEVSSGLIKQVIRQSSGISSAVYSPDSTRIVSCTGKISYTGDNYLHVWNAITGDLELKLFGHSSAVHSAVFSPNGVFIASCSSGLTVRVYNLAVAEAGQIVTSHSASISSMTFSLDGTRLASGSMDSIVRVWDTTTGECEREMTGHSGGILTLAFSSDGSRVASGSWDFTVRVWNTARGGLEHVMTGHDGPVFSVNFSPDGTVIASGSADKTVRVWNSSTGSPEHKMTGHTTRVSLVAFSPDGAEIASASFERTLRVWSSATGSLKREVVNHSDTKLDLLFSPDRTHITWATAWDAASSPDNSSLWLNEVPSFQPSIFATSNYLSGVWMKFCEAGSMFWIPTAYANFTKYAAVANTIAFGYGTGRVIILRARPNHHTETLGPKSLLSSIDNRRCEPETRGGFQVLRYKRTTVDPDLSHVSFLNL